jgi:hypothetical protein
MAAKKVVTKSVAGASVKDNAYYIHSNGGRPYMVTVSADNKTVSIYEQTKISLKERRSDYQNLIATYARVKKVFVPTSYVENESGKRKTKVIGSSILIELPVPKGLTADDADGIAWYVYIGEVIYQFNIGNSEKITAFYSPINNSDCPDPYAFTEEKVIMFTNMISLSRSLFPEQDATWGKSDTFNPYDFYYNNVSKINNSFDFKFIHKGDYTKGLIEEYKF